MTNPGDDMFAVVGYTLQTSVPPKFITWDNNTGVWNESLSYGVYRAGYVATTPNGPSKTDDHQAWIGRNVQIGSAFGADTWNTISGANSVFTGWKAWKEALPGRRMALAVGMIPNTDTSTTLAIAATGAYDSYFTALATNLVANNLGNSIIRLGWEMNLATPRWSAQGTGANGVANYINFRDAWIRYVNAMRAVSGANFTFCFNTAQGRNAGFDAQLPYPGDAYVDDIGLDFYDVSFLDAAYPNGG